eukprot:2972252-Rhodomonas_salina.1
MAMDCMHMLRFQRRQCTALSYSQRGRFHSRHRNYWMVKMWLGEPDFDDPGFMPAPYRLAYICHSSFSMSLLLRRVSAIITFSMWTRRCFVFCTRKCFAK